MRLPNWRDLPAVLLFALKQDVRERKTCPTCKGTGKVSR